MLSLNTRLLLAASLVLAGFVGLTGIALDGAFRQSAQAAARDRLQGQVYALLAAAELTETGELILPAELPDARLSMPGSGLYAQVQTPDGFTHWRSPSLLDGALPSQASGPPGEWRFARLAAADGSPLHVLGFAVAWEGNAGTAHFTFRAAESLEAYHAQVGSFRRSLWGWLLAGALVLLAVQGAVLRWGLTPLRRAADDLRAIEAGRQAELQGRYPHELRGLTENLNALLRSQRRHLQRYRDSLADLAHSLKTPLAVLRGTAGQSPQDMRETVLEQVQRMNQIVDYQLQRAAASGRSALAGPVALGPLLERIAASMDKVYADKSIDCRVGVSAGAVFHGDEADLMELLGNPIENAFKWARTQVAVQLDTHNGLAVTVEDDGPGIAASQIDKVLERGVRADQQVPGHGIGLAVVKDIVEAYGGTLSIGRSPLGGAAVRVSLPGR